MATIEEILSKCSAQELRYAADENRLSDKGTKVELVSSLASSVPPKKILGSISNKQLQAVLATYQQPRSGTKDELVKRVLALVTRQKQATVQKGTIGVSRKSVAETKKTAYKKGHEFEERVAKWAARKLKGDHLPLSTMARGIRQRPHDIDVHIRIQKRKDHDDIWIECKNMQQTVKSDHIRKLVQNARDTCIAVIKGGGEDYYPNGLMFVSTSRFDTDAINLANEFEVLCFQYEEGKFVPRNNPNNWLGEPKWLKQARKM